MTRHPIIREWELISTYTFVVYGKLVSFGSTDKEKARKNEKSK